MWGNTRPIPRIAIIGVGQVGATTAYALILGAVTNELLLVDIEVKTRSAQLRDLSDAASSYGGRTWVRAASHQEAGQCDIVIITAEAEFSLGETSIQRLYRNAAIIRNIVDGMKPIKSNAVLLVAAHPIDLLTTLAVDVSGLPMFQVLGLGTCFDSARLRTLLAEEAEVSPNSVEVSVYGVQGDSQVIAWSTAKIDGMPADEFLMLDDTRRFELEEESRNRLEIISSTKGEAHFGISTVLARVCTSIIFDTHEVCPISYFQPEFGCCFSLPAVLGNGGILKKVQSPLGDNEESKVAESVTKLRAQIERMRYDH